MSTFVNLSNLHSPTPQNLKINHTLCMSIKSKKDKHLQCPKKKKPGSHFCGVHIRTKKVTRIDGSHQITLNVNKIPQNPQKLRTPQKRKIGELEFHLPTKPKRILKEYYTLKELNFIPAARISLNKITKSIKKLDLEHYIDLTEPKDIILANIRELHLLYELATANLDKIIKIQAFFRMLLIHNRTKCVNPEDFLTFEELHEIPAPHFFNYKNPSTNKYYGFNVQTFHQLVTKSKTPQNPYTRIPIPASEIERINKIALYMKNRGYEKAEEMLELTEEQQFNNRVGNIFSKIDDLGNYTDTKWFTDLDFEQLKDYYIKAEDIWSYRLQMPHSTKERIVNEGIAFGIHTSLIKVMQPQEFKKLQNIVLTEIDKLVSEGQTEDDKRVGAMIILTAFTEVVPSAASAMPHYVQSGWAE